MIKETNRFDFNVSNKPYLNSIEMMVMTTAMGKKWNSSIFSLFIFLFFTLILLATFLFPFHSFIHSFYRRRVKKIARWAKVFASVGRWGNREEPTNHSGHQQLHGVMLFLVRWRLFFLFFFFSSFAFVKKKKHGE